MTHMRAPGERYPLALADAIAEHVQDGITVALEGFTHLIPFAAAHEIVRHGRRDLTLVRMTPDVVYDQLIGWGLSGVQKEAVLAARAAVVTVEELVDELEPPPHAVVLPHWTVSAVCVVPGGAWPSYAAGYSVRDNAFYAAWDDISRDRERFLAWMREHVLEAEEVLS